MKAAPPTQAPMSFGCCHGFCESQASEVINTESLSGEGHVGSDRTGTLAPMVISGKDSPEQEGESSKMRLRRVIREFAHKVVGQGLEVQANYAGATGQGILRMDKRLSRLEIAARSSSITIALTDVQSFKKGFTYSLSKDHSRQGEEDLVLTVISERGTDLELTFDSTTTRDHAFTCMKIFHMSISQSVDGQSLASSADHVSSHSPESTR